MESEAKKEARGYKQSGPTVIALPSSLPADRFKQRRWAFEAANAVTGEKRPSALQSGGQTPDNDGIRSNDISKGLPAGQVGPFELTPRQMTALVIEYARDSRISLEEGVNIPWGSYIWKGLSAGDRAAYLKSWGLSKISPEKAAAELSSRIERKINGKQRRWEDCTGATPWNFVEVHDFQVTERSAFELSHPKLVDQSANAILEFLRAKGRDAVSIGTPWMRSAMYAAFISESTDSVSQIMTHAHQMRPCLFDPDILMMRTSDGRLDALALMRRGVHDTKAAFCQLGFYGTVLGQELVSTLR